MDREGVREAADRRIWEKDNASSTRMRLFLGCGKSAGCENYNANLPLQNSMRENAQLNWKSNVICEWPSKC